LQPSSYVAAVGGANYDLKLRIAGPTAMRSSNPGSAVLSPGGAARNIAENLAHMGVPVKLASVVGRDEFGRRLLAETAAAGVDTRHVRRGAGLTGLYAAVLDEGGQMLVGASAMDAFEAQVPGYLAGKRKLIERAGLIVADGNLPLESLKALVALAADRAIPLILDPTSVPKAGRLAATLNRRVDIFSIFCNRDEAEALTGRRLRTDRSLAEAARHLHDRGVRHVAITLGRRGAFASSRDGGPVRSRKLAAPEADPIDVTGAGDAALAGTVYGLHAGHGFIESARYGLAAAALTIGCARSVDPKLSAARVEAMASRMPG
jgi:pseudouridine kinase